MVSIKVFHRIFPALAVGGLILCFGVLFLLVLYVISHEGKMTDSLSGDGEGKVQSRLVISKLKIDVPLESVGLTSKGEVGVPKEPTQAAWFSSSSRPGDIGIAIVVGHYGWEKGVPAVFDALHTLEKGDEILVIDVQGKTSRFVVRKTELFNKDEDAQRVFWSDDKGVYLNLITCEGAWNKADNSYEGRLVVFSDLVE